mgnify:CR=1 FL=1
MSFAERNGLVKAKAIQTNGIDDTLRNRLYNALHFYNDSYYNDEEVAFVVDRLGYCVDDCYVYRNWNIINGLLLNKKKETPWYMPYEIIELFFEAKREQCEFCDDKNSMECNSCEERFWFEDFKKRLNRILEEEKAGYRFINDKFIKIVDKTEIDAIKQASDTPYSSVNIHIKKALSLYSDRKNPDYENSIKESISAVEAMCCIITGMAGASATLGAALKKLEDNGVVIHGALREAFAKIYGYTSDAGSIRHGSINFKDVPAEDAKYMLVSCSAFVNYLIEKYSKVGGTN